VVCQAEGHARQRKPGSQQRQIEGAAIEADHCRETIQEPAQSLQHGLFFLQPTHEELDHSEAPVIEAPNAHQKHIGAGTSHETCGFGVQKGRVLQVQVSQTLIPGQLRGGRG